MTAGPDGQSVRSTQDGATVRPREFATRAGTLVGTVTGGVVRVARVPYATARRFEPPRDLQDVRAAGRVGRQRGTHPPASPQRTSRVTARLLGGPEVIEPTEDCHVLTVTLPADLRAGERLPVIVWIHGGGYTTGAGELDLYDPRALVCEQRVVVVAVTYRLGVLGFLGDGRERPANLGLLDVLSALRWVRTNIGALGGAADCVTLMGQSSGADAVLHLMACTDGTPLFRRVILQSPPICASGRGTSVVRAMLRVTRSLTADTPVPTVLDLQARAERAAWWFGARGAMPFGVQYGHAPLPPLASRERAVRDVAPSVDMLVGSSTEETGLYLPLLPLTRHVMRQPALRAVLRWMVVRPTSWLVYGRLARRLALRHRDAGGRAVLYRLAWSPPGSSFGAVHSGDLALVLGTDAAWRRTALVPAGGWQTTEAAGRAVRRLWADFARTGSVGVDDALDGTLTFHHGHRRPRHRARTRR